MARKTKPQLSKSIETLTHDEATRKNIPTAEYQSVMQKDHQAPVKVSYLRGSAELADEKQARNRDLDPQLVWRGKDQQDWSDLVVQAPPLYVPGSYQVNHLILNDISQIYRYPTI